MPSFSLSNLPVEKLACHDYGYGYGDSSMGQISRGERNISRGANQYFRCCSERETYSKTQERNPKPKRQIVLW